MVIVLFVLLEVGHVDWFKLSQEREQTNLNSVSFLYTVALISLIRAVKISGAQSLYEWKVYNKFSLFIPRIVTLGTLFSWQMFAGPSPKPAKHQKIYQPFFDWFSITKQVQIMKAWKIGWYFLVGTWKVSDWYWWYTECRKFLNLRSIAVTRGTKINLVLSYDKSSIDFLGD